MDTFHGIVVNQSLDDQSVVKNWNILNESKTEDWSIYTVSVGSESLDKLIKSVQVNMIDGPWYAHFYNHNGSSLVIIFKNKTFNVTSDKQTWKEALDYAESLKIPRKQLDFYPAKFKDEK